ncbi:FCD domain-containing protein [Anaerovirgula multivorans]|uniref:FCD domain-containing protein n=1 Tax=Anaerovirgula multivorans TaxID=312168 RepID=A0A239HZX3_9FIRM|nr:FCD domain-containing protein [Anaerovirgula multivorans]SNS85804.1 FCD domain-containing protein [Anaerovirgula multivorans]
MSNIEKMGVVEDPLGFSLVKDKHKLASDLMQIRLMLEPQIASLAAQNAKPDDIERLGRLCDEKEKI